MKRKSLNANPIKREKERYQTCMLHTVAERERKSSHCEPKLTKRISSIFAEAFFNSVLKKVESEITVIQMNRIVNQQQSLLQHFLGQLENNCQQLKVDERNNRCEKLLIEAQPKRTQPDVMNGGVAVFGWQRRLGESGSMHLQAKQNRESMHRCSVVSLISPKKQRLVSIPREGSVNQLIPLPQLSTEDSRAEQTLRERYLLKDNMNTKTTHVSAGKYQAQAEELAYGYNGQKLELKQKGGQLNGIKLVRMTYKYSREDVSMIGQNKWSSKNSLLLRTSNIPKKTHAGTVHLFPDLKNKVKPKTERLEPVKRTLPSEAISDNTFRKQIERIVQQSKNTRIRELTHI